MTLKETIILMQKELRKKVIDLNSGGCIHFAGYFSKALQRKKIPHKVYCGNYSCSIGRTYSTFDSVSHVVVLIEDIGYIDGYSTKNNLDYTYRAQIKLRNFKRLGFDYEWNNAYDIDQNELVEEIINKYIQ